MRASALLLLFTLSATAAQAEFWDQAVGLLQAGQYAEAGTLAQGVLAEHPNDADALVIAGTAVLYQKMEVRRDDSIFQPDVDVNALGNLKLPPEGASSVASYWSKVPAVDPQRAYLWGDLAQLTFRTGDSARALDFAGEALALAQPDADTLRSAASVYALNLEWVKAAQALARIPGERTTLLYQGLEAWRTGKDGWRVALKAFVDNPGPQKAGATLAAYLLSSAMRDSEAGYQAAIRSEDTLVTLVIRQKYVERYPDKFQPRLDLARSLSQHGSFVKALVHYAEIDRKGIASTPEEKTSVLVQEAWAQQGAGHRAEAARLWDMLTDAKDFYIRSAACWFLGQESLRQAKPADARQWWSQVSDEPARSKYAAWAAAELKNLR